MNTFTENITSSRQLTLSPNTENTLHLTVNGDTKLELLMPKQTKGVLFLEVDGEGKLELFLHVERDSSWSYLWVNKSNKQIFVNEYVKLEENAYLRANYGEFNHGKHQKESSYDLLGERAKLEIQGAVIAFDTLDWNLKAYHKAKNTYSHLQNYGVIYKGASLTFNVLGHILKGYRGSSAHQVTRVLNMNAGKNANVYPQLVIDENDVEASHAASVGQIDAEMIYYLKSRGIPHQQVVSLVTMGYLTPILEIIENESIRNKLLELIAECVK